MVRKINRLSARKIETLTEPGMHADGGGLYLRISGGRNSGKRWVFLYKRPSDGKRCELGLGGTGGTTPVSLARARDKAIEVRRSLADGNDPLTTTAANARMQTFGELADQHIVAMGANWRNQKHRAQWVMTLAEYAKPIRDMPVNKITTAHVLDILRPIWSTVPETASRTRGRIEAILDAAKAQGFRTGENPAAWRGHLKMILPARQKLSRGHHAAMAIDDVPALMTKLRTREGIAARCLEFAILTAARSGEALGAKWAEFDIERKAWTVPADRMKGKREHVVPLSARAVAILKEMLQLGDPQHVFPGQRRGSPLSSAALTKVLHRLKIEGATTHGFRSSFRDWAGNRTSHPRELAEHALAHIVGDKAEQAYRRDTAVERRRALMEAWAQFCCLEGEGSVHALGSAKGGFAI